MAAKRGEAAAPPQCLLSRDSFLRVDVIPVISRVTQGG